MGASGGMCAAAAAAAVASTRDAWSSTPSISNYSSADASVAWRCVALPLQPQLNTRTHTHTRDTCTFVQVDGRYSRSIHLLHCALVAVHHRPNSLPPQTDFMDCLPAVSGGLRGGGGGAPHSSV